MASGPDAPALREERKVVTAFFADLVGSTAVGERFDPEDAREIVSGAIALMIDAVERFGGTVKDLAGDGILALFGAPVSHEDDVERAILAGLDLTDAIQGYAEEVARIWGHRGLDVRVGIETGLAVLGPVGAGGRVEYGAVGDVLNTAARLQSAARSASVLVGEGARREVESLFRWESAGALTLKGKDKRVVASTAVKPTRSAAGSARRTDVPFVGRTAELDAIDRSLTALAAGHGSAIVVTGEPGLGKSRLVAEARRRTVSGRYGRRITWLEGRCLSWADGVPYGLYRDVLAGSLGISPDDGTEQVISVLSEAIGSTHLERARLELIATVLAPGGPTSEDGGGGADAEAVRERVFDAVREMFTSIAASDPLVLVLEDLHWADPTSLALTERLLPIVADVPLLILVTRRPEPEHHSAGIFEAEGGRLGERVRSIVLSPLSDDEHRQLFRSIVGDEVVPERIRRPIADSTEGNPFFLEEQVRSLQESGRLGLDADGQWRFEERGSLELPRTVERVLLSRIDRLPPDDKDVLVAASVLGREFDPSLLGRLVGEGLDVGPTLDRLARVDLVRAERRGAELRFRFKHAMIQEAAYRSLLKRRRRELHGRAAEAIESSFDGRTDAVAGTLGHHLAEAGELARAVPHLMTAGDRAREAYANEEALAWYERALDALGGISRSAEADPWRAVEADLQARRGDVLTLRGRYDEARKAFAEAIVLAPTADAVKEARLRVAAAEVEISDHRYREALAELDRAEETLGPREDVAATDAEWLTAWLDIEDGRMSVYYWLDDLERYAEVIDRVRPILEERGTAEQRAYFFGTLLTYCLRRDRYAITEETLEYARANMAAAEEVGDPSGAQWASFNLGFTLLWAGELDEAVELLDAARAGAERIGDVTLRSRALTYRMVLDRRRGDASAVERSIGDVVEAAREASLPEYEAMAIANRAWVHARAGRVEEAGTDARTAIELWRSLPARYPFDWMALWPLVEIELTRGRIDEAVDLAGNMLADSQQPLPEVLRSGVEAATLAWRAGESVRAAEALRVTLSEARHLAYA